jgi:uncharacterized protein YjdB
MEHNLKYSNIMKKNFNLLSMALVASSLVFVTSCDKNKDEEVKNENNDIVAVTGVSVNPTSGSLTIDETVTLKATVTPDNATDKTVTWASSAPGVASVDAGNGVVTGEAAGTAVITVTTKDGNKTASATVTVTAEPAATITIGDKTWYGGGFLAQVITDYHSLGILITETASALESYNLLYTDKSKLEYPIFEISINGYEGATGTFAYEDNNYILYSVDDYPGADFDGDGEPDMYMPQYTASAGTITITSVANGLVSGSATGTIDIGNGDITVSITFKYIPIQELTLGWE